MNSALEPLLQSEMTDIETPTVPKETSTPQESSKTDQPSTVQQPGKFGTYMSFVLVLVGIIVSIIVYKYAPNNINNSAFEKHCTGEYEDTCKSNSAVLRISCAMTITFAFQLIGSRIYSAFYDIFWPIKGSIFFALSIGFFFVSSDSFGTQGYAWFARITGFFYLILQQIILIDLAFSWNQKWLDYATEEGEKGKFWLGGILFFSFIFFAGAYAAIGVMYWQFQGCSDTAVILSLTIILTVIATAIQLFLSDEGSILTSAIMTAYAAYICYSAIVLNPDESCNPSLNTGYQTLSAAIGIVLTVISLLWTTYSTVNKIPTITDDSGEVLNLTSVATGAPAAETPKQKTSTSDPYENSTLQSLFVQVSLVFLCVSGYYAMVLTNWATDQQTGSIDHPRTGRSSMWIQAAGQWIAIVLYIWSLIAPKVLTNREFN